MVELKHKNSSCKIVFGKFKNVSRLIFQSCESLSLNLIGLNTKISVVKCFQDFESRASVSIKCKIYGNFSLVKNPSREKLKILTNYFEK